MSRLKGALYSLKSLLRHATADRETAEEIADHIERQSTKHIAAGLAPEVARALAINEFGGAARFREETSDARAGRWIEHIALDVRYAWRVLLRNPGFTAVGVVTLGVGIGGVTSAVTIVDRLLLRPLSYPASDRLVSITSASDPTGVVPFSEPNRVDFTDAARSFQSLGGSSHTSATIGDGDALTDVSIAQTSGAFFETLATRPLIGRTLQPRDAAPGAASVVVISYALWRRQFGGDNAIVGKPISLGSTRATVVGVMPPHFEEPAGTELWMACRWCVHPPPMSRASLTTQLIGRLAPGVTLEQASAEANVIARRIHSRFPNPSENQMVTAHVEPLLKSTTANARGTTLGLAAFVGFILLIGCANLASANLARNAFRMHELALRAALGAERRRIVIQLVVESLMLSLSGGFLGLGLAFWCLRLVALVGASRLPRLSELALGPDMIAAALLICVVTAALIGLIPALQVSARDLRVGLASQRTMSGASAPLRSTLVAGEIALSLILTVGAALTIRTLQVVERQPIGVDTNGLITVQLLLDRREYKTSEDVLRFDDDVIRQLAAMSGVGSAAVGSAGPLGVGWMGFIEIEGRQPNARTGAQYILVSESFAKTVGLSLLRGRWFTPADDSVSEAVTVIDRTMADRYWPDVDPIGKRFRAISIGQDTGWLRIVGVVAPMRTYSFESEPSATHYVSVRQRPELVGAASLIVRATGPSATAYRDLRRAIHAVNPRARARFVSFDEHARLLTSDRRLTTRVVSSFAVVALFLAGIGVYGVLSYSVALRTREIGIRVALGAARAQVIGGVVREMVRPVALGVAAGLLGTLLLSRVFQAIVFGVRPNDPIILLIGAATLTALALASAFWPARRAALVDPVLALRSE